MLTGPRACGKTTTAARHAAGIARLDRPRVALTFQADPDAALSAYAEPVLLDEWQEVPSLLGAVKRAVDADSRPGRFILTGSVRADLEGATWPGTGRVVRVPMYGLAVRELEGRLDRDPLFDRLRNGDRLDVEADLPDLRGYVELALRSGFPEAALAAGEHGRQQWLEGYVDQLLTRDVPAAGEQRDPARLRRYLEAYALNSAGIVSDATLLRAAGINSRTATAYEQLLINMFVIEPVPPWSANRLRRLSRSHKRYFVDPAIPAATLRLDADAVLRDGDLLGRVLDTFVAAQIRTECGIARARPHLYHLREEHGRREIDLLTEIGGREVLAFEVKATGAPDRSAAKHLLWLRDQLGERFIGGVLLHTGLATIDLDDRVTAAPIAALWT